MMNQEHFMEISKSHGGYGSWAVWIDEDIKPKSNMGDMSIFDLNKNPQLLNILNPNVIMVGLNISKIIEEPLSNFHGAIGGAYKIRYAFRDTPFYGAYMTDIIKDFEEKISGNVLTYLKKNQEFERQNVNLFRQEIKDLNCDDPLIIAFGNIAYNLLQKHFGRDYRIKKVTHYSHQISKENYREEVLRILPRCPDSCLTSQGL